VICTPCQTDCYLDDKAEEDEMGGTFSMHGDGKFA
jgi:hypothetical protein